MSELHPNALKVSRTVLGLLIKLNLLMGFFILALLIATFVAEDFMMRALTAAHAEGNSTLVMGMRAIMVIGIGAVPLAHIVLTRLRAIVETVTVGDPFVSENAARLQTIAWTVLVLELMNFAVGSVAQRISSTAHPIDIDWKFSVTPWLAVLLLFVLARVFDQGTRMREELAGTV